MEEGVVSHSYGIEVARLAGLPPAVLSRAREILKNLERGEFTAQGIPTLAMGAGIQRAPGTKQMDLFSAEMDKILSEIKEIDLYAMTPLDALNILNGLIEKIKKIKKQ
jgi:DNA mismatch repair protein MutS